VYAIPPYYYFIVVEIIINNIKVGINILSHQIINLNLMGHLINCFTSA